MEANSKHFDKNLIDWIRIHLNKGYSVNYIRNYLLNYGYTVDDVDRAIDIAKGNEKKHIKKLYAFYFSLVGGLLIMIDSILRIFDINIPINQYVGFLAPLFNIQFVNAIMSNIDFLSFVFGFMVGLLFMVNSLLLIDEEKAINGAAFSLVLSIISFMTVNGFYIGFFFGIISMVLGFIKK